MYGSWTLLRTPLRGAHKLRSHTCTMCLKYIFLKPFLSGKYGTQVKNTLQVLVTNLFIGKIGFHQIATPEALSKPCDAHRLCKAPNVKTCNNENRKYFKPCKH